jgi:ABC-type multidrug transport system, ATPase component
MPQSSYAFSMSVKSNILLSQTFSDRNEKRARMDELVTALGLKGLLRKNAAKLSGGETQRMALARTLLTQSDILLLDEPTAAMDVEQAQAVIKLLKKEVVEKRLTLIFATHSLKQAEELADEVLYMSNGVVVERGTPKDTLHNPVYGETKAFVSFNS